MNAKRRTPLFTHPPVYIRAATWCQSFICTMRSPWSFVVAGTYLVLTAKTAVGGVVERQSVPDVTILHAWHEGTDLGVSTTSPFY